MGPVFLNTTTNILGLMPLVLSTNIDFLTREVSVGAPSTQWRTQLSVAIVFGLGFATVLTLIVILASLVIPANVQRWLDTRRSRRDPVPVSAE